MFGRNIGKVINVESFRVIIELEKDIKTLYKSGYQDIYEIARINSYVVLPVGAERIVALVTKVKISDETEIEVATGNIALPKAKRYIIATMVGTIDSENNYTQGVSNFPILDNPVWYVMKEDLNIIFDSCTNDKEIDYAKDYFLPIGTSSAFMGFDIKINPDKFFSKHAAILGNTGSGKSCTISTILQSVFKFEREGKSVKNAHVIIFDTNGEYKRAFDFDNVEIKNRVNTFNIGKEGLRVPYWFMNYDDFDYLFKPSEQTQAPILKRAIAIAKQSDVVKGTEIIGPVAKSALFYLIQLLYENRQPLKNFVHHELDSLIRALSTHKNQNIINISQSLAKLKCNNTLKIDRSYVNGNIDTTTADEVLREIEKECSILFGVSDTRCFDNNIDIPKYFDFKKLFLECIDDAIAELVDSKARYAEFLSSLKLRLSSYCSDERYSYPFLIEGHGEEEELSNFLKYITGMLTLVVQGDETVQSPFYKYRNAKNGNDFLNVVHGNPKSQITILDMSLLPSEIVENIAGLVARLLIEFLQRIEKVEEYKDYRGKFPIVLILEEAQNYIPEIDKNRDKISISKRVFERIAREGRKFGLSLVVSSQRPSELSKTILSQCNTFIVHRLQNPEDQRYIRQLVSSATEDILNQLPILPQQNAIVMGDAVRSPVQVKLYDSLPKPDSDNPQFFESWLKEEPENIDFDKVVEEWTRVKT